MKDSKPIIIEEREFESKSSPGTYYETIVRSDGLVACNCKGWTMKKEGKPRRCAHTDKVIGRRPTVDDGTYTYIAALAPRIVAYSEARKAQAARPKPVVVKKDPNACPECGGLAAHWGTCSRGVQPPVVVPPILATPGRRRITFDD